MVFNFKETLEIYGPIAPNLYRAPCAKQVLKFDFLLNVIVYTSKLILWVYEFDVRPTSIYAHFLGNLKKSNVMKNVIFLWISVIDNFRGPHNFLCAE